MNPEIKFLDTVFTLYTRDWEVFFSILDPYYWRKQAYRYSTVRFPKPNHETEGEAR